MTAEQLSLERRAAIHAALAEPARLAIVDTLMLGDASPGELGTGLGLPSNLLAHHLRALEAAGLIRRSRSEADRRRSYIRLVPSALAAAGQPGMAAEARRVVFVCTRNSARSQLAAALWQRCSTLPAASAGTDPAPRVHHRAIATARKHGLKLQPSRTSHVRDVIKSGDLVVTVCDHAFEELGRQPQHLHWSVPDPVTPGTDEAFESAFTVLEDRVGRLSQATAPPTAG